MIGEEGTAEVSSASCAWLSKKDARDDISCCCSERISSMMACCALSID